MKTGLFYLYIERTEQINLRINQLNDEFSKHFDCAEITIDSLEDCSFILVCVMSGGTEHKFVELYDKIEQSDRPFVLIAQDTDNSLPAAIEILSWLREYRKSDKAAILTGTTEQIANEAYDRVRVAMSFKNLRKRHLGVIGEPSEWLIASRLDLSVMEKKLGFSYTRISMQDFIEKFKTANSDTDFIKRFSNTCKNDQISEEELEKTSKVYAALKSIVDEHNFDAITFPCFDLVDEHSTTACLALAYLNEKQIVATCEGDVATMVSMVIAKEVSKQPSFMANPSIIEGNEVVFAHCSAPSNLVNNIKLNTHYETNKGIAISGEMPHGKVTIFKAGSLFMGKYALFEGEVIPSKPLEGLCRTQVRVRCEKVGEYLLNYPLGNHHLLIEGSHTKTLEMFCKIAGMSSVL